MTTPGDSAELLLVDRTRRRNSVTAATTIAINNTNPPMPATMPPINRLVASFELSLAAIGIEAIDVEFEIAFDSVDDVSVIVACDNTSAMVVMLAAVLVVIVVVVLVVVSGVTTLPAIQMLLRMSTHSQMPFAVDTESQLRQFVSICRSVCSEHVIKLPANEGTSPDKRFA